MMGGVVANDDANRRGSEFRVKELPILSQERNDSDISTKQAVFVQFWSRWGSISVSRTCLYLLLIGVVCQALTVWITLPLWGERLSPPNLPTFPVPPFDFAWPVFGSLALILILPRPGMALHWGLLIAAGVMDQYRLQPQFYAIAVLMSACVWPSWHNIARWFLVSTWLWAGLHKLVSADWYGHASYWLLNRAGMDDASNHYVAFAIMVALSELGVGILGCVKPRWATFGCVPMHLGIMLTLSPICLDWNASVQPWNATMALIGGWVMWTTAEALPKTAIQRSVALVWMVFPLGFFIGWVDHGFCGVLYSDSLPRGQITTVDGPQRIRGWGELHVPFPNERRTLRMFFEQSGSPGDFLHISDPRYLLNDLYFVLDEDGVAKEITAADFYSGAHATQSGPAFGYGLDELRAIFPLRKAGVTMLREAPGLPYFAVAFTAENFDPSLLVSLKGLPNIRQVQLAGTGVVDADLKHLRSLPMLTGVGLDNTAITDAGVLNLAPLAYLSRIEYEGTAISENGLKQVLKPLP
jgi:hypothetical protein